MYLHENMVLRKTEVFWLKPASVESSSLDQTPPRHGMFTHARVGAHNPRHSLRNDGAAPRVESCQVEGWADRPYRISSISPATYLLGGVKGGRVPRIGSVFSMAAVSSAVLAVLVDPHLGSRHFGSSRELRN